MAPKPASVERRPASVDPSPKSVYATCSGASWLYGLRGSFLRRRPANLKVVGSIPSSSPRESGAPCQEEPPPSSPPKPWSPYPKPWSSALEPRGPAPESRSPAQESINRRANQATHRYQLFKPRCHGEEVALAGDIEEEAATREMAAREI